MYHIQTEIEALGVSTQDACSEEECEILYGLVKAIKPLVCVETGTHLGISASYIATALKENSKGHLYTCDVTDWGQKSNIEKLGLKEYVTTSLCKGSVQKVPDTIDFLFIDSYHEKEVVLGELYYYLPKLAPRAVVVFHDAGGDNSYIGVNEATKQLKLKTVYIPTRNGMRIYCKEN